MLEALDAIDTGVEMAPEGVELLYKDSTGLSSRVSRTNPRWNEVDESTDVMTRIVESDIPARDFGEFWTLEITLYLR